MRWNKSRLSISSGLFLVALLLILYTAYVYSGSRANRLGPPLGQREGLDFEAFMTAARAIQTNQNPYEQAMRFGRHPSLSEYFRNGTGYAYPPFFAVALVPFAGWADETVGTVWVSVSFILLFVCAGLIVLILNQDGQAKPSHLSLQFVFLSVVMFAHYPTQLDLKLGQTNIFILFLMTASFGWYRKRSALSGLPLAMAIAIKPFLGVLVLFLVWKKDWRAVAATVFATLLLFGIGFMRTGWSHLSDWMAVNAVYLSGDYLTVPDNQSFSGLITRLFATNFYITPLAVSPIAVRVLPILFSVIAVIIWMAAVRFGPQLSAATEASEFSLTLLLAMLLSPVSSIWHYVWVLLPLACLLHITFADAQTDAGGRRAWMWVGTALICALYLGSPNIALLCWAAGLNVVDSAQIAPFEIKTHLTTSMCLYGLIGLYTLLAWRLRHPRQQALISSSTYQNAGLAHRAAHRQKS